jgi:ppGpp synthetase/RelA/SpoT-type nucleotidyltranferase
MSKPIQIFSSQPPLQEVVESILGGIKSPIHIIAFRTKHIDSVVAKLREEGYPRPARQLTDSIGVRVITY